MTAKSSEPNVLPSRIPNLCWSTVQAALRLEWRPISRRTILSEVIDASIAVIRQGRHHDRGIDRNHARDPIFRLPVLSTARKEIWEAYGTGRGRIYVRARTEIEQMDNDASRIVVTELPYQVNKARLLEKIAELVKDKKLSGIRELRDESDKDGMRMVIELKRGEVADVILNNLYQQTQMQSVFGINMVALGGWSTANA